MKKNCACIFDQYTLHLTKMAQYSMVYNTEMMMVLVLLRTFSVLVLAMHNVCAAHFCYCSPALIRLPEQTI